MTDLNLALWKARAQGAHFWRYAMDIEPVALLAMIARIEELEVEALSALQQAGKPADGPAPKHTMTLTLTEAEQAALEEMVRKKDLEPRQIFRQALAAYQLAEHEREHGPIPRGPLGLTPADGPSPEADDAVVERMARAHSPDVWELIDKWEAVHSTPAKARKQQLAKMRAALAVSHPPEGA